MASRLLTFFNTFTTNNQGQISLTGIQSLDGFSKVNIEIAQFPTAVPGIRAEVSMGKLTGTTVAQVVDSFLLPTRAPTIKTLEVVGPEFNVLLLGGPPNTPVGIQGWVYLH
jgi:hypothetical protein